MPEGSLKSTEANFDAMVDACITAGEAVMEHGSDQLRALMRILLLELGHEVAQRMRSEAQRD